VPAFSLQAAEILGGYRQKTFISSQENFLSQGQLSATLRTSGGKDAMTRLPGQRIQVGEKE
jgi:hypothetical protein